MPTQGKAKKKLVPGDLMTIPAAAGGSFRAIFITRNRFGDAFGFCRGRFSEQMPTPDWQPEILKYPSYCHLEYLWTGRWKVVGRFPEYLKRCPTSPESYLAKHYYRNNPLIGEYGAAESADGTLRQLTEQEADELGLGPGFSDGFMSPGLEDYLNAYNAWPLNPGYPEPYRTAHRDVPPPEPPAVRWAEISKPEPRQLLPLDQIKTFEQFLRRDWFQSWDAPSSDRPIRTCRRYVEEAARKLIRMEGASLEERLGVVRECVEALNSLNARKQFIDSIERDDLCDCLAVLMRLAGLEGHEAKLEQWRDW